MVRERVVANHGPFELLHRMVGCSRYWYVRHAPSGKLAASWDGAPCSSHVKAVVAKFRAMVADWPPMDRFDPANIQPEEITRLRALWPMLERVSATEYRVSP